MAASPTSRVATQAPRDLWFWWGWGHSLKKIEHIIVWAPVLAALSFAAWQTYAVYAANQVQIEASRHRDLSAQQAGFLNDRDRQEAAASGITDAAEASARLAEENRPPTDRMDISGQSWKTTGFGSIGVMTLTLNNGNNYAVKDFVVSCSFWQQ